MKKKLTIVAAALMALMGTAGAAQAQNHDRDRDRDHGRYESNDRRDGPNNRYERNRYERSRYDRNRYEQRRGDRHDRNRGRSWDRRNDHCKMVWRNHREVRICR